MPKYSKTDQAAALDTLRRMFPAGSTVYTILRHVSTSGMARDISIVAMTPDGHTLHPNHATAAALGLPLRRVNGSDAVRIGGCGMDMGFHLVNSLSWRLYGEDYALTHRWL